MTMDQASLFLSSSILLSLGIIIVVVAVLIVNNLLYKYWKPLNLYKIVDPEGRFIDTQEKKNERTMG